MAWLARAQRRLLVGLTPPPRNPFDIPGVLSNEIPGCPADSRHTSSTSGWGHPARRTMTKIQESGEKVIANVERVIVGKHHEVRLALVALLCRGHLLIEDVPGTGKTMLAKAIDGTTHKMPDPFIVIATQNPIEYEGTFALPEAQLDRFMLRIRLGYPQPIEEVVILDEQKRSHPLEELEVVCSVDELRGMQGAI